MKGAKSVSAASVSAVISSERWKAMLKKVDLRNQVNSLDVMIRVLSDELTREPKKDSTSDAQKKLLAEMEEALRELRQARGIRKVLLTALESRRAFH
ncbi:MAG: hypothetical protein AB1631_18375 [Acidobacteriota bacterium]